MEATRPLCEVSRDRPSVRLARVGDVLVINAGSTGVKLRLVDGAEVARPIASLDAAPGDLDGVGHRVVHGGGRFSEPARIEDALLAEIEPVSYTHLTLPTTPYV